MPFVYLILGASGSGRRAVVADLIQDGIAPGERTRVFIASDEAASSIDPALGEVTRWRWLGEGGISTETEAPLEGVENAFFITDGRLNPVDQIEAFKPWLAENGGELGRILCVVNCRLAEQHRELVAWYEACIHFADIVLLAEREGVANKWLSDFQNRFKNQFYPCLFEFVKAGKVKNPALILTPEPRRLSHYFDETEWTAIDDDDQADAEDADEEAEGADEEVELVEKPDPYLERLNSGRRVKEIPDITKYLEAK